MPIPIDRLCSIGLVRAWNRNGENRAQSSPCDLRHQMTASSALPPFDWIEVNVSNGSKIPFELTVVFGGTADTCWQWSESLEWGIFARSSKFHGRRSMAQTGSATTSNTTTAPTPKTDIHCAHPPHQPLAGFALPVSVVFPDFNPSTLARRTPPAKAA